MEYMCENDVFMVRKCKCRQWDSSLQWFPPKVYSKYAIYTFLGVMMKSGFQFFFNNNKEQDESGF